MNTLHTNFPGYLAPVVLQAEGSRLEQGVILVQQKTPVVKLFLTPDVLVQFSSRLVVTPSGLQVSESRRLAAFFSKDLYFCTHARARMDMWVIGNFHDCICVHQTSILFSGK